MNQSFFVMKTFSNDIIHLEACGIEDAKEWMIEEHGISWADTYMLFSANRVYDKE